MPGGTATIVIGDGLQERFLLRFHPRLLREPLNLATFYEFTTGRRRTGRTCVVGEERSAIERVSEY